MENWEHKLKKSELIHLMRHDVTTWEKMEKLFKFHKEWREKPNTFEPCFVCKCIARKLGFEV